MLAPLYQLCCHDSRFMCNLSKSVTLRMSWINDSLLVCDRFHYCGHTCNSTCDPRSYALCSYHATCGTESINQLWTFSNSHLRFLKPENLIMPFIAARSIFLNVRALVRETTSKDDISSQKIVKFIQEKWTCTCVRCTQDQ